MKLVEFNPENSTQLKPGQATIRINRKAGLISFSKQSGILMGLKKGMKILFYQDEENPMNWYIRITSAGFPLRTSDEKAFDFNNSSISHKILDSCPLPEGATPHAACGFYITDTETVIDGAKYFPFSTDRIIGAK